MVKGNTEALSCEVGMGVVVYLVPALHPATKQAFVPLSSCLLACSVMSWYTRGNSVCVQSAPVLTGVPLCSLAFQGTLTVQCGVESASPCSPLSCRSWESNGVVVDYVTRETYFYNMLECSSLPSGSIPAAFYSEKVGTEHPFLTDGD